MAEWEAARDAFPVKFRMKLSIRHEAGTCVTNNLGFTQNYEQDTKHLSYPPHSNRGEIWAPLKSVENCSKVRHGKK